MAEVVVGAAVTSLPATPVVKLSLERQATLLAELRDAICGLTREDGYELVRDIAGTFCSITVRRGVNVFKLVWRLGTAAVEESANAAEAHKYGRLGDHAKARADAAVNTMSALVSKTYTSVAALHKWVAADPGEAIPELVVGTLAFLAAGGGLDGDGGIPDLDLLAGIGAHRSIFTHSVIAGAVVETSIYALVRIVDRIHKYLPPAHDPIWDHAIQRKDRIAAAITKGASAGIAYHLFVDGAVQPAPYHGLPVPMPIQAHEAILEINAGAEALDVGQKSKTFARQLSQADKHRQLRRSPFQPEIELDLFTADEEKLLHSYGTWLRGLDEGTLQPTTDEQKRFVRVCRGEVEPGSLYERVWVKYQKLVHRDAAAERIRILELVRAGRLSDAQLRNLCDQWQVLDFTADQLAEIRNALTKPRRPRMENAYAVFAVTDGQ
jgi:uncharacterized protein YifE (UPF0438 family)